MKTNPAALLRDHQFASAIQNSKRDFELNDRNAFSDARKAKAEQALEKTMKTMVRKYPRPEGAQGYVAHFILPWEEYFPFIY